MCQIKLYYHVNQDLNEITSVSDVIMSWLSKSDFTGKKNIMRAMRIALAQFGPLGPIIDPVLFWALYSH